MVGFGGEHDTGPDNTSHSSGGSGSKTSTERSMSPVTQQTNRRDTNGGGRERAYNEAQKQMAKRGDTDAMQSYQEGLEKGDDRYADMAEEIHSDGFSGAMRNLADLALRGVVPGLGPEYAGVNDAGDPTLSREWSPLSMASGAAGPGMLATSAAMGAAGSMAGGAPLQALGKAFGAGPVEVGMTPQQMAQHQSTVAASRGGGGPEFQPTPAPQQGNVTKMLLAQMFGGNMNGQ